MAERVLKKLEEQLCCAVCLDVYSESKQLHRYCQRCLEKLVKRNRHGRSIIHYHNCCKATPLPKAGVAELQTTFRVNSLLEIQNSLKEVSDPLKDPPVALPTPTPSGLTPCCSEHASEELKLYCHS